MEKVPIVMKEINTTRIAEDFEESYKSRLRKVVGGKSPVWFAYDGGESSPTYGLWVESTSDHVHGLLSSFIRAEAKTVRDADTETGTDAERKAKRDYQNNCLGFLRQCLSVGQIRSIAASVGSKGLVLARLEDFDAKPGVLAVVNGVLDLTGDAPALHKHHPRYMLTKKARARYVDASTSSPTTFTTFVHEITCDEDGAEDGDLLAWIQKLYGYTLSGRANEDVIPIYIGAGCNGKSKLMEAVDHALGSYAGMTDIQELAGSSRFYSANNEALADLQGLLFAWCDEMPMHGAWDPAKFKRLTGGTIRAMRKFRPACVFKSTCIIHLGGQHLPAAMDLSNGFWRRVRVVPFRRDFDEVRDENLLAKLQADADSVLKWIVEGWKKWKAEGLGSCPAVDAATLLYRENEEANTPLGYLAERCEIADPTLTEDPAVRTPHNILYPDYADWCKKTGSHNWGKTNFKATLEAAGYTYTKARYVPRDHSPASYAGDSASMPTGHVWVGIKLPADLIGSERWRP